MFKLNAVIRPRYGINGLDQSRNQHVDWSSVWRAHRHMIGPWLERTSLAANYPDFPIAAKRLKFLVLGKVKAEMALDDGANQGVKGGGAVASTSFAL